MAAKPNPNLNLLIHRLRPHVDSLNELIEELEAENPDIPYLLEFVDADIAALADIVRGLLKECDNG
jgi:hypothetical protein